MFKRKGNAVLQYGILVALVISTLLIMQAFIKRGYQGSLKASANRIGEQFSTSSETIKTEQTLSEEGQVIDTHVLPADKPGVYTWNTNTGAEVTVVTQAKSGILSKEKARLDDYATDTLSGNITDPDLP